MCIGEIMIYILTGFNRFIGKLQYHAWASRQRLGIFERIEQSTISLPFKGKEADVTDSTLPGTGFEMNGNCNHVDVDLNSLKRLEKEILTMIPSCVATSL